MIRPSSETPDTAAEGLFAGPGEMRALCRSLDWSATPLGPVDRWPVSLRTAARLVLAHPFPHALIWGPDLAQIYNDGYRALMGPKHPAGLGQPTRECWPEFWPHTSVIVERVRGGESVTLEEALFPIVRSGVQQDAWFTVSYSPVYDEEGGVAGVLSTVIETTGRKRAEDALRASEERQAFLLHVSDALRPIADPIEIMMVASEALGRQLNVGRCGYGEVDPTGEFFLVARDWTDGVMPSFRGKHHLVSFGPEFTAAYRAGRSVLIEDALADARAAGAEAAFEAAGGVRASLGLPIIKGGRFVAGLFVQQLLPRRWSDDDERLSREVIERTWEAVERARAEAALREGEDHLRTVLEGIAEPFYALDRDDRFLFASRSALRTWGKRAEDVLGRVLLECFPQAAGSEALEAHRRVMRTGEAERLETISTVVNQWIEIDLAPTPQGGLSVAFRDVEARKQAERRQAFLLKLSDALRPLVDPGETLATSNQLLGEYLQTDRTYHVELDHARGLALVERDYVRGDAPSLAGTHPMASFEAVLAPQRAGQPFVCEDADTEPRIGDADRQAYRERGLRSFVTVPLLKKGELVGTMALTSDVPRAWRSAEVALVQEVAERTWAAVERARTEAALRASEARGRALIANLPGGAVFVVDQDLRYQLAEGEALRAAGFTAESFVGRTIDEVISPDLAAQYRPTFQQALGGKSFEVEHSAHGRVFLSRGVPLWDGDRRTALVVSIDITERRQAENHVTRSEERQAFLLKLGDALRPLGDPVAIQETASRCVGEYLRVNRAAYGELEPDDTTMVVARDWTSPGTSSVVGAYRIDEFGTFFTGPLHEGRPAVIADAANDPRVSPAMYEATWGAIGVRAGLACPLIKDGRLVAALFLHQHEPRRWSDDEVRLVVEVGERTWEALERARTETRLRESEARLAVVFEVLPVGVSVMATNGTIVLANHEMHHYLPTGLLPSLDDARRWRWRAWHADGRPVEGPDFPGARALRGESVRPGLEMLHASDDGRDVWTHVISVPIRGDEGQVTGAVVVVTDIDALKRTAGALHQSEARFRALVENVRDYAIFGLDPAGFITEWTAGAERVKGYTAAEVVGRHLSLFYIPEDVEAGQAESELSEAAATGRAEREGWCVRKDGTRIWVNEIVTAVHGDDGALRGFTKIGRDLTAQRLVEDERARLLAREQEARQGAERAMVLRDEFLAVISHELRTPLSAILLWSKMLLTGAVPPAQQPRALASIDAGASAQKKLIEDMLDVSGMLSGKVTLSLREVALGPVLEAAVAAVQPTAEARGVQIETDLEAGPVQALVDPDRLQQIVWNLLTNAVKFTPRGGRVRVRLVDHGALVRFSVEDMGQGIAPEFLPYVFERFRQQDASITRAQGGLGLGLAIARGLVELHGGTITAQSEGVGRGATFTVELPGRVPPVAAAASEPAVSAPDAAPALAGVRVLLVEDDSLTSQVLQWVLEHRGAHVTATASASEALAAFAALDEHGAPARFDVLVSDIGLPDQDGYTLIAALRQRPAGAALPALALTAYARADDRQRVLAAGFDAYLAKPVEPRPLVEAVSVLAGRMTAPSEER